MAKEDVRQNVQENGNSESDALKAKIAELESQNKQLAAERDAAQENHGSSSGSYPIDDRTSTTKPAYKFSVWCFNKKELPKQVIRAVDEGEAIRLYSLRNRDDKNRPLDTVSHALRAECLEVAKRRKERAEARARRNAELGYPDTAATMAGGQN